MGLPDIRVSSSRYGTVRRLFNVRLFRVLAGTGLILALFAAPAQAAGPVRILALGDSLTAGYGLPQAQGFTVQLEHALKAKGYEAQVINAGVSGDTAAG